jgi:hypothetical protein
MDWIDLAKDRDQWRAPVNRIMNLRVPQIFEKFLIVAGQVATSQEGLSSMELVIIWGVQILALTASIYVLVIIK